MTFSTAFASLEDLQQLSVPARPNVNPRDVTVPDGYEVEVLLVGLSKNAS